MHKAFLDPPTFTIPSIRRSGDLAVAELDESYLDESVWATVLVLRLHDGLIATLTGHFGVPFPAPERRRPYTSSP